METRLRATELALDLISPPSLVKREIVGLYQACEKWFKHEGLQGIKRGKSLFDYALDYLMGQPCTCQSWLRLDQDTGTPMLIKHTLIWGKEFPKEALTLLRIHELFVNEHTDEQCLTAMETITAPSCAVNSQEYIDTILEEAANFTVDSLKVKTGTVPMFTQGPNGISILSGHLDVKAHNHYGTIERISTFLDTIADLGIGMKTSESVKTMLQTDFGKYSGEQLGRVVFLAEKSGKLRVIAQGDYITQCALKPIHDTINGILAKIRGDYTFDQEAGKRWAQSQTKHRKWMASFDMSAATDRLPVWLQAKILDVVMPGSIGEDWLELITNRDFMYTLPSGRTGTVRYSVGQPMGFYSSFAAFALLHHLVVRAAYRLAHKGKSLPKYQFYAIIGDDMVITDKLAGDMYVKIITDIGGVINLDKSRLSNTPGVTICEFAKAWFTNGKDITPYSLRAIRSSLTNWSRVPAMFNTYAETLGRKPKAKKLKFILQKYWPKEANPLIRLIPVPQQLGGFGKPDSNPLVDTVKGENGNAIRTFIANKLYTAFKSITQINESDIDKAISNDLDPRLQRLALSDLAHLVRTTDALVKFPYVNATRRTFVRWVTDTDTSLRTLLDWYDRLIINLPVSMREVLDRPSLGWIRALEDDRKLSPSPDTDIALQYAAQELMDLISPRGNLGE